MGVGRIIRNRNSFERVTLTEEEEQEVLEKLRERNIEVFKWCLEDASRTITKGPALLRPQDIHVVATIAGALFEKQAISSSVALNSKLEEKVFYVKEYAKSLETMQEV